MMNLSTSFFIYFVLANALVTAKKCWNLEIQKLVTIGCRGIIIWSCKLVFQVKTDHHWPKVTLHGGHINYTSSDNHQLYLSNVDNYARMPQQLSITFYNGDELLCATAPITIANQHFNKSATCVTKGALRYSSVDVTFKGEIRDCSESSGSTLNLSREQVIIIISASAAVLVLFSVVCCVAICYVGKHYKKQSVPVNKAKEAVPPVAESPKNFLPHILSSSPLLKKPGSTSSGLDKRSVIQNPALTTSVSLYHKITKPLTATIAGNVGQTKPELIENQKKENQSILPDKKPEIEEPTEISRSLSQTEQRSTIRPKTTIKSQV